VNSLSCSTDLDDGDFNGRGKRERDIRKIAFNYMYPFKVKLQGS
jgi:hypothetical protein